MNVTTELHRQAMELADHADAAGRTGDHVAAQSLFRRAFHLEREAAETVMAHLEAEPTRSVLLRSAASLAMAVHEYREAERLIAAALAGNPPDEVCEELRDLLDKIYSESDLRHVGA